MEELPVPIELMVPLCCPPRPWLLQKDKNINELDNRNKKLTQTNILAKLDNRNKKLIQTSILAKLYSTIYHR
jgi:hypothetical protein